MDLKRTIHDLRSEQTRVEHQLETIRQTIKALSALDGVGSRRGPKLGRKMSASTRRKMRAAAKRRWAARKQATKTE